MLNRGERLLRFPLNELENDLVAYQKRGNRKKSLKEEYNALIHGEAYLCWRLFGGGRLFEEIRYSETRVSLSPACVSWRFLSISYQVTVGSVRYSPPDERKCGFFA